MKTVLVIAGLSERYYFEPFIKACDAIGISVFVFDPSRYPANASISLMLGSSGAAAGFIDVVRCKNELMTDERLLISEIDVAWYLRENAQSLPVDGALEARFSANESRALLRSMYTVLDCRWVNRYETINHLSSNKLYQQLLARSCGLTVPITLLSNDPDAVAQFSEPSEGLLLKAMGYMRLDDNFEYHLYSERFAHSDLTANPLAIRQCPVFCQEYVKKRWEHRVMVIGDRVLSCRIDSQASEMTAIDWRHYDFENVEHVQVDLPSSVQVKLRQFMKLAGLHYGAIDMIETPDNDFVFLEVNPSGQWGWIADLAGLPVAEAVADMLADL